MKDMIKKNKNTIICIFLAFFVILANFQPKTYSKYLENKSDALIISSKLKALSVLNRLNFGYEKLSSNKNKVTFTVEFARSNNYISRKEDSYKIITPSSNNCVINSITTKASSSNKTTGVIKYTNNGSDTNKISLTCDAKLDASGNLSIPIVIKETINNSVTIEYANDVFVLPDYLNKIPNTEKEQTTTYIKIPIMGDYVVYDEVNLWLQNAVFIKDGSVDSTVQEYATSYLNSKYNSSNITSTSVKLGGLNYVKTDTNYEYYIEDNIVDYVKTYNNFKQGAPLLLLNFTVNDETLINKALKYYLNEFLYPSNSSMATKIYNYIVGNGGIKGVLFGSPAITIPGVLPVSGRILLQKPIEDYAYNYTNTSKDSIRITIDSSTNMQLAFNNGLSVIYDSLPSDVRTAISSNDRIKNLVNSSSLTGENIEAITVNGTTYYVDVYSNGTYNYIKIFNNVSSVTNTLSASSGEYKFNISGTNAQVLAVINKLNTILLPAKEYLALPPTAEEVVTTGSYIKSLTNGTPTQVEYIIIAN